MNIVNIIFAINILLFKYLIIAINFIFTTILIIFSHFFFKNIFFALFIIILSVIV